jgi:hypothetical protein
MDRETFIEELMTPMRKLVERAYDRGFADNAEGVAAMKKAMLEAMGVSPDLAAPNASGKRTKPARPVSRVRAPKGAVSEAVVKVFREGLTTKEIEQAAEAQDPSINTKTVYNELWRRKELYRQEGGRWYRANTQNAIPPADPLSLLKLNGSAGGHEAQHGEGSSARAPVATGEVGGT